MTQEDLKENSQASHHGPRQEYILFDGYYFESLLNDIKQATTFIDLEVYIFSDDSLGMEVMHALADAAKRGVKVRVLVDGVGTARRSLRMVNILKEADVETRIYHPLPWMFKEWVYTHSSASIISKGIYLLFKINKRNHRKTCVIDGYIAYVGSANIAKYHLSVTQGGEGWHDANIKLINVDTKELTYAFEKAWSRFPLYERVRYILHKVDRNPIFRLNYSWRLRRALYRDMLLRIKKSKKRVWISNAYFVPNAFLLRRLIKAAKRGVDVRILLPKKSDVFIYPLISAVFYERLLKAGIAIYEYLPSVLHAKMLILDDTYYIGSSNLNYRSIRHDLEVDVNVRKIEAKLTLEKQFLFDLNQSRKMNTEEMNKQRWYKKMMGRILLYVQYWL